MKNLLRIFNIFIFFTLPIYAENLYENLNPQQLKRLDYLAENIRCPKCSYGNINSSNAPISKDLKQEIASLIKEGYSNDEIFKFMEERYGNYVILKTDINENKTLFLIPLIVLLISILLVTTYTIKRSK
ncbi:MAG: hypothetical protein CBC72_003570 [Gammaproteobacteria bacterium TMED112]|nr:MAG: hypothetical protein CBC72_003570 [Gammaproteobacteria bacterium TMED112]|tara:strand:+ start:14957 stop:15343 length:387 start_codon:yes stop_codon:yes gene_type:complete